MTDQDPTTTPPRKTGRPSLGDRACRARLTVRFTDADLARLQALADSLGSAPSEIVRKAALLYLDHATSPAAARPTRRRHRRASDDRRRPALAVVADP